MKSKNLIPYLSYWYLDPRGFMLLPNGQVEVGVEIYLGPDHLRTDTQRDRILEGLRGVLESYTFLPPGGRIRFIVEARPADPRDVSEYLESKTDPNPVLQFLTRTYANAELRRVQSGERTSWRYFITLKLGKPRVRLGNSPIAVLFNLARQNLGFGARQAEFLPFTQAEYEQLAAHALETAGQLASHLSSFGIWATPLSADEIHNIVRRFWNHNGIPWEDYTPSRDFHTADEIKRKKLNPLSYRRMVAQSELINIAPDRLYVGDRVVEMFEMFLPPRQVFWNFLDPILPAYPHYAVLDISPTGPLATQNLQRRYRQAARFNEGARAGDEEASAESLAEDFRELLRAIEGEGARHLLVGFAMALDRPGNEYQAEALENAIMSNASNYGIHLRKLREFLFAPYLKIAPFAGSVYPLSFDTASLYANHMLTHNPPFRSTRKDRVHHLLPTRHGSWVKTTPYAEDLTNFNGVILGASGSGKTFSVQTLLADLLADEDVRVIVVDKKGDYIPMLQTIGGQIIEVSPQPSVPTSINMFDLEGGSLDAAKQALLDRVFLIMADYPPQDKDRAVAEAMWRLAYHHAYGLEGASPGGEAAREVSHIPTLPEVITILENIANFIGRQGNLDQIRVAREAAIRLRKWAEGPLANLIARPGTVKLEGAKITYFDLRGLDQLGDDRATALAITLVANTIYSALERWPRRTRKIIVFDEARSALQIPEAADLIADLYRRARSLGGSTWTMTQAIHDFLGERVQGILSSSTQFLIYNVAGQEETIAKILDLPPESIPMLSSVHRKKGHYAEAFWYVRTESGHRGEIIRFVPTPVHYWLFTSDAQDVARREEAIARHGGDVVAAVAELAGMNPREVKATLEALKSSSKEGSHVGTAR